MTEAESAAPYPPRYTLEEFRAWPVCPECRNRFDPEDGPHWLWTTWCNTCGINRLEAMVRRVVAASSAAQRQAALKAIDRLPTAATTRRQQSR